MNNPTFLQLVGITMVLFTVGMVLGIILYGFPKIIIHKKCNCKKKKHE